MPQKTSKQKWVDKLTLFRISFSPVQRIALSRVILCFLVVTPVIIFLLPIDFFDQGTSLCLSQLLFDSECYACGLTRGCKHLLHLDVENAFAYNMGSFLALPLVSFLWLKWFISEWRLYRSLRHRI
ncbi:MAG: DUF2752 domain-containing protein [Sphingomonadales bacterium]|jgi:hypothetical protein